MTPSEPFLYVAAVSPIVLDDRPEADLDVEIPDESDAPADLRAAFWSLVVVFNAAVLAASVGAMVAGIRGDLETGGVLLGAGLLAFAFGVYRLRNVRERL